MTTESLAAASGANIVNGSLGEIVTWKSPKEVDAFDLQNALTASGFRPNLVRDMQPRHAFSRACKSLSESRIIRKIRETSNELVFQFTKEYLDEQNSRMEYDYETELTLDKASGTVQCPVWDLEQKAQAELRRESSIRKSGDITRIIQKIFDNHGDLFPIREQGGAYFVPARHTSLCDDIQEVMDAIGGSVRRYKIDAGDVNSRQSASSVISEQIESLVNDLDKMSDEFISDPSEGKHNSFDANFNVVQVKLNAYKDLLDSKSQLIQTSLDSVSQKMSNAVRGLLVNDEYSFEQSPSTDTSTENKEEPPPFKAAPFLPHYEAPEPVPVEAYIPPVPVDEEIDVEVRTAEDTGATETEEERKRRELVELLSDDDSEDGTDDEVDNEHEEEGCYVVDDGGDELLICTEDEIEEGEKILYGPSIRSDCFRYATAYEQAKQEIEQEEGAAPTARN